MRPILRAASVYFAVIFAAGFVLGTFRVLVLAPAIGALAAVALEVPVILGLSWVVAGRAVARHGVPGRPGPRMAMGAIAFVLLMAAEVALGVWGFGQTPAAIWAGLGRPEGLLGLAGQVAFGLVPLARLGLPRGRGWSE